MLILSRRITKSIMIGDDIKVTIVGIDGRGIAHIAIEAPRNVPVDREEVREAKLRRAERIRTSSTPRDQ